MTLRQENRRTLSADNNKPVSGDKGSDEEGTTTGLTMTRLRFVAEGWRADAMLLLLLFTF